MRWNGLLPCLSVLAACLSGCGASTSPRASTNSPEARRPSATAPTVIASAQTATTTSPLTRARSLRTRRPGAASSTPQTRARTGGVAAAAGSVCDWTVDNPGYRNYTTPGSYDDRGFGSCPPSDLSSIVSLVTRFRDAALTGGDVCALLPAAYRANARRWALAGHSSCSAAALQNGDASAALLARPLAQIRLITTATTPAREFAFVIFRALASPSAVPRGPLVLALSKPSSAWQLDQIGYQF